MKKLRKIVLIIIFIILILIQNTIYAAEDVSITSEAAILVEVSTGRIIYEKESNKKMWPASTTKIMTAIIVLERCSQGDIVTVKQSSLDLIPEGYVTCPLVAGEEISVGDLLKALMIKSANDAAYVLADYVGGSIEGFADLMNKKAEDIGCKNTHFVNPNGIHNEDHYSTAYDLYLIANYAMKNENFRNLVLMTEYTLPATNKYPSEDRYFSTTNSLINPTSSLYNKNVIGIKTGYTSEAGNCLVSEASRDGLQFISVTLKGDRFTDTNKLFDYAYDNYTLTRVIDEKDIVDTIEIENATKETKNLDLLIDDSITVVNNKSIDINAIIPEITLNENIEAPITAGTKLGKIKYKVDDIEYSANLIAASDVEKQTYYDVFLVVGIILLIISFLMLKKSGNKKKRKVRRKK